MSRHPREPELIEMLDVATGIAAFFTLATLAGVIVMELRGDPALSWALTLLGLVVLTGGLVAVRRAAARVAARRARHG